MRIVLACLVAMMVVAGCGKKGGEAGKPSPERSAEPAASATVVESKVPAGDTAAPCLAQVGEQIISVADLRAYGDLRPTPDYVQDMNALVAERLDELVVNELLAQEAVRLGIDRRPQVRLRIQQILAQVLLDELEEGPARQAGATDAEVREYYDAHQSEFCRPQQRRLADIFVAVDANASAEDRSQKRTRAEQILAQALAAESTGGRFSDLIRRHSDQPRGRAKGDLGFFDAEGRPGGVDPRLVAAAFGQERIGAIYGQVVETADGYHIVMLVDRRAEVKRSFEQVKGQISRRLHDEKVDQARRAFLDGLRAKTQVAVNKDLVAETAADMISTQGKGPPAGPQR